MSKRVLSAFLVVPVVFLGLNFFIPSFIKPVSAAGISGLIVGLSSSATEARTDYEVSFRVDTALTPGDKIEIKFPPGYVLDGDTDYDGPGMNEEDFGRSGNTVIYTVPVGPSIIIGENVTINLYGVKNPTSAGPYTIEVKTTKSTTETYTVNIVAATSGGSTDIIPDISCSWRAIGKCIKSLALWIPKLIVNFIVAIVRVIIGLFITVVIWVAAKLIGVAQQINAVFEDPVLVRTTAAYIGFQITLALTNIGFVISIIFIAFATILRRESFAIKAALPRLIITAILINFSWFFAIQLITLSNNLGDALVKAVTNEATIDATGFSSYFTSYDTNADALMAGLDLGKLQGPLGTVLEFLIIPLNGLVAIATQLIFGLLAFFALIATAVLLLIRYVALNLLLILMPLALLANIFPNLGGGLFNKWQGEFSRWLLFYPASLFFIAVAFKTQKYLPVTGDIFITIGNTLAVAGILIGGLIVSSKLGLAGAAITANRVAGWASRKLANKGSGFIGNRLLRGTQLGAQMQQQQLGLAGAGAGLGTSTAATGRLDLKTPVISGAPRIEEGIGGMGGIMRREIPAGSEQPEIPLSAAGGQPETLPGWTNITPRSVRKVTAPLRPGLRERMGASMVKYSFGGDSLGGIMRKAIPKDLGIFGEVASLEGTKKAEERLKKGQAVIEDLEKKTKKVEDTEKEKDEMEARQFTMQTSRMDHEDKGAEIQAKIDDAKAALAAATNDAERTRHGTEISRQTSALERHGRKGDEIDNKLTAMAGKIGKKTEDLEKARAKAAGVVEKKAELKEAKGTLEQMTGGLNPNKPSGFRT